MQVSEHPVTMEETRELLLGTVRCKIVGKEIFKYPISGSKKYQNELLTPKYVGMDTLIINME